MLPKRGFPSFWERMQVANSASPAGKTHESEAATLTPPGHGAGAQPNADITALTDSDDFLLELAQALGGLAALRPVDSIEAAIEGLAGKRRAQLLVVDARDANTAFEAVKAAATRAPHVVVLVFAPEAAQAAIAAALRGLAVFALLPTPIDARGAHALLERALTEAAARKDADHSTAAAGDALAAPLAPQGARPGPRLAAAAAAVLVALAAGAYWMVAANRDGASPAPAPARAALPEPAATPSPGVDLSIVDGKVDDLLEKARAAMRARHYTDPVGDNALLYYRSAAAADPASGEAKDGLQRVAGVLGDRFEEAMTGAHLNEAALTLTQIKAAVPNYDRLASYSQQLATAAAARQRADLARRQADADAERLAGLVADRIRGGKLVDGDDSAKAYVEQLQKSAAANAATARALHDFAAACLHKARDAALANDKAGEDRWIGEARRAGSTAAELTAFQRDVAGARIKAAQADGDRLAQLARQRMRDGSLTAPAKDSAAYYLGAIRASDAGYPGLASMSHDLAEKLIARARAAVSAGKSADDDLAAAKVFGADPQEILAVRQQKAAAKPADGSSAPPSSFAARLKLVRAVQPIYPDRALERRIGGTVIVKFTVDARGYTRDVGVVKATPPGMFEHAAIDAVRQWRYAPVLVDGKAVAVPADILVRFKPPK